MSNPDQLKLIFEEQPNQNGPIAQAARSIVAHEASMPETTPEEPYERPTSAVPSKNADAGSFKPISYADLTPDEKRVADNEVPPHIRHL